MADQKYRYRGFLKFDISGIPAGATIDSAILYVYYYGSYGVGVSGAAPSATDVGNVVVDHIEDFGTLDASDFQMAVKSANIGAIIALNIAPAGWYSLDVTSYVQADLDEEDTSDTSCFRLRQSTEESFANCTESNAWYIYSGDNANNRPHLDIDYTEAQYEETDWNAIPDWFYWGPRATMEFDLRSGNTSEPDDTWTAWQNAEDNEEFEGTLHRYVQQRFYAWIPQDVRLSRNSAELPQFIYRLFNLKWWGREFAYGYYYYDNFFADDGNQVWGVSTAGWGTYRFAGSDYTSPTLYDELPVFEV